MIRNNPDIAAVAVLTLALAVCPVYTMNLRHDVQEPRLVQITERLEANSARIAEAAALKLEQRLGQHMNLECLKQKLHE